MCIHAQIAIAYQQAIWEQTKLFNHPKRQFLFQDHWINQDNTRGEEHE